MTDSFTVRRSRTLLRGYRIDIWTGTDHQALVEAEADESAGARVPDPSVSLTEEQAAIVVIAVLRGEPGPPGPMGMSGPAGAPSPTSGTKHDSSAGVRESRTSRAVKDSLTARSTDEEAS